MYFIGAEVVSIIYGCHFSSINYKKKKENTQITLASRSTYVRSVRNCVHRVGRLGAAGRPIIHDWFRAMLKGSGAIYEQDIETREKEISAFYGAYGAIKHALFSFAFIS